MPSVRLPAALCCLLATGASALAGESPRLEKIAEFRHQVTGVAVSESGRLFVNFPRWSEDAPLSVAEVKDGSLVPYPDERWNSWRNAKKSSLDPTDRFVCVQSVVADQRGNLWVLDPAAPATAQVVKGGPKLVRIDLASNSVAQVVRFDETAAPQGSYLNDVRISADGRHAFVTDSGAIGALLVVDLASGSARRVLDGHSSTKPDPSVVVKTDGKELRRPDGRGAEFAADGIALSRDGRRLYWQALTGKTLYSLPTAALTDASLAPAALAKQIDKVGENGVSDGLLIARNGEMYISALEENAIKVRRGDKVATLIKDERLRWPDTFAEGPDGSIYVTASRIMDMAWYKPDAGPRLPTSLWRFGPAERGLESAETEAQQ